MAGRLDKNVKRYRTTCKKVVDLESLIVHAQGALV